MDKEIIYWDANCCLKWIKQETGFEILKGTMHKAKLDEVEIRTSAFSLVEVFYWKENDRIIKEKSSEIKKFFEEKYVVTIPLDIPIAELAREIYFNYKISSKDAIHVASAIFDEIHVLNTFDQELLDNNGKIGTPPLKIVKPNIPYQESLL